MIVAEQRCRAILRDLLSDADAGARRSHLLLAVAVGPAEKLLNPQYEGGIKHKPTRRRFRGVGKDGSPASTWVEGFTACGLNALQDVQTTAQDVQRQQPSRKHLNVVPLAPFTDSGMRAPSALMHMTSKDGARFDANFTAAVQAKMRALGGAYDMLRDLRTSGKLQPYWECKKSTMCFTQGAAQFPLRQFEVPADPKEMLTALFAAGAYF